MRHICLAALFALLITAPARADIVITRDLGGTWSDYSARVDAAAASGERVRVDGVCASGCTLFLVLPRGQVCATARGVFVFHAAIDSLTGLPSWRGTQRIFSAYPPDVQIAIGRRGGLWIEPIRIAGIELVPPCDRTPSPPSRSSPQPRSRP